MNRGQRREVSPRTILVVRALKPGRLEQGYPLQNPLPVDRETVAWEGKGTAHGGDLGPLAVQLDSRRCLQGVCLTLRNVFAA